MDISGKFLLPSPKFEKLEKSPAPAPHFLSPEGMLLPKEKQPPPMYGPRGSTVPPKFLPQQQRVTNESIKQPEKAQKYFCEPCEAELHTSTDYKVHRNEHTQCEIGNCSFRGHPSFMDTHIAQQHSTGLYDQLKKLSTPEEIAQWRAERKKNYPTVASVEQKWKAREQRMLRGEKLEASKKRFGRQEDRRQMKTNKNKEIEKVERPEAKKRQRKRNKVPVEKKEAQQINNKSEVISLVNKIEELTCGGLKMFRGTSQLPDYRKAKKTKTHALSSFLGMYGSHSESEDDIDKEEQQINQPSAEECNLTVDVTIKQPSADIDIQSDERADELMKETEAKEEQLPRLTTDEDGNTMKDSNLKQPEEEKSTAVIEIEPNMGNDGVKSEPTSISNPTESDDEAPEEAPIEKSSNIPDKPQSEPPQKKAKREPPKKQAPRSGLDYRKLRSSRQNTMLEKLLEPDIRHERNVLLQCVRFVLQNNFFGIGSSSQMPP